MGQAFKRERFQMVDPIKMADRIIQFSPATDAEALKLLRVNFPDCPLSERVAALDFLMRRPPRGASLH
jgi:hypothetical protein